MTEGTPTIGTTGNDAINPTTSAKPTLGIQSGPPSDISLTKIDTSTKIGKKFGLGERICNNLSAEMKSKLDAANKVKVKVKVKWYTKLVLKLGAFWDAVFARGDYKENYRNAKREWRAQALIANAPGLLDDLVKTLGKLDGQDLKNALEEIYKLLGGDTSDKRYFLSTNC
jgi:hypothetical protein